MAKKEFHTIEQNPGIVSLEEIPVLTYEDFRHQTIELLSKESFHCLNYFTLNNEAALNFIIAVANDDSHRIHLYSHNQKHDTRSLKSITTDCYPLHIFEREIAEKTGIVFEGHPWLKPVRYPFDRYDQTQVMSGYPFYHIDSEEIHEVGVGPIHAGVIEPGHFRFNCYGEKVLHLEIQLGYQHRGVETLFLKQKNLMGQSLLSESIAGDSAVAHAIAFSQLAESLACIEPDARLSKERIIALEMERIAVHIGDTAALCGDVAFQIGQAACEALRTVVINTMQDWCGNRFGKGLIRPGGTNYPLNSGMAETILNRMDEVSRRFEKIAKMIYSDSGVIARFENVGAVTFRQAMLAGAVGMAARTSGMGRDIRRSHPFQAFKSLEYNPAVMKQGDVFARAYLRKTEVEISCKLIMDLIRGMEYPEERPENKHLSSVIFKPGLLCVSLVEGWRGEICHIAVTGKNGELESYKIKDPSFHNWLLLALAVREQEISDFPVCNKSFNLSYCGNDL